MNPSDGPFLVFLALLVPAFALAAARLKCVPVLFLLAASLFFYATWNPFYLVPLAATALTDYAVGRGLGRARSVAARRGLLAASLLVDLSLLACFKYYDALAALWSLAPAPQPHLRILFMTGISFYTFQSMSYVLDVYRGDQPVQPSFLRYLAFVSFFPTLLAGPITRADTLMPQLEAPPRAMDPDLAGRALFLIALGFVKKCLVADYLAESLANRVFEQPLFYSGAEVLAGVYAYAAQIYCDFSGYSDIAIGAALLLGFRLKDNFKAPYRSASLSEFWQRWHISFSTWLRDYVFFSFPGVRRKGMAMFAILATFVLGGLWHGASWCFLAWGLIHGLGLAAERLFESRGRRPVSGWRRLACVFVTFHVVVAAWVFFRAENLETVAQIGGRLSDMTLGTGNIPGKALVLMLAVLASQALPEAWFERLVARFSAMPAVAQAALLAGSALLVRFASAGQIAPFIYQGF
ncbi:MAG TPA: MBOAT family O-acyltransferase [Holophaga sp.]|nr:MBOAT family O-acyltransferase [Holophaga sp.]HPS66252.1 MBOAT family O-acyltransferase [Holophaga sp.]